MRKSKKRLDLNFGDLISLRSCVPESLRTQIESHESNQCAMWVDNGALAIVLGAHETNRVTVMCNGFVGWVWRDECKEVKQ